MCLYGNSLVFLILTGFIFSSSSNVTNNLFDVPYTKVWKAELIDWINIINTTWTATKALTQHFPKVSSESRKLNEAMDTEKLRHYLVHNITQPIPESFDSRTEWPLCDSIGDIRAQGQICFSCWAFAAVEVMADRICIHSGGATKVKLSPEDVIDCCPECGNCSIGYTSKVWHYWIHNGIVTGGDLGSNEGCKPYTQETSNGTIPSCNQKCQENYPIPYEQDKYYGENQYYVGPAVEQIQTEIMLQGPVEALFSVYDDFNHYESGVYQHVTGDYVIDHFVKIIGWGVEKEVPYWLVANSWGKNWGDAGFFKILRGENYLGIENQIDAGIPAINNK